MRSKMLAVGFGLLFSMAAAADVPTTRQNLLLAYEDDVNAQARYSAFAEQAEREGYRQAARLFRATAEAEQVHANSHAQVLRHLGAEPTAETRPVSVESTRANLSWTLAHESMERNRSYPRLAEQGRRDGNAEAVLSFIVANAAHDEVVKLYQEAISNLRGMRDAREELHVCGACGHVAKGPRPTHRCPVSLSLGEAFARVD